MLSVADALAALLDAATPLPPRELPLVACTGRILTHDLIAPIDLPGFDNSQMDGYAVHLEGDPRWRVIGSLAAGSAQRLAIGVGEAARVFTGSPLPDGTDAVLMQEVVERIGEEAIVTSAAIRTGQFIRRRGSDLAAGSIALHAGDRLTPAAIGLAASLGLTHLEVTANPSVGILSTGDELVAPGGSLGPNQQFEGNTTMLAAALQQCGVADCEVARVADQPAAIHATLSALLDDHELVLITGGVSVGDHDHIRSTLAELGAETLFWGVKQRPGKPLLFARRGRTLILGLPGNPASTLACFYVYGWPLVRTLQGHADPALPAVRGWLYHAVPGLPELTQFVRGRIEHPFRTHPSVLALAGQASHQLRPFALANCLIVLPPRPGSYEAGEGVECLLLP